MKIYTKTGDAGETQIYAKQMVRMRKDANVLECYGSLDELNAHLGLLLSYQDNVVIEDHRAFLMTVQKHLFQIGFAISAETHLTEADVTQLEQKIDQMQSVLAPQTQFILPGGHRAAALSHVCRTIARRAERRMVALLDDYQVPPLCLRYLNRLSDFLFVLARSVNASEQLAEHGV